MKRFYQPHDSPSPKRQKLAYDKDFDINEELMAFIEHDDLLKTTQFLLDHKNLHKKLEFDPLLLALDASSEEMFTLLLEDGRFDPAKTHLIDYCGELADNDIYLLQNWGPTLLNVAIVRKFTKQAIDLIKDPRIDINAMLGNTKEPVLTSFALACVCATNIDCDIVMAFLHEPRFNHCAHIYKTRKNYVMFTANWRLLKPMKYLLSVLDRNILFEHTTYSYNALMYACRGDSWDCFEFLLTLFTSEELEAMVINSNWDKVHDDVYCPNLTRRYVNRAIVEVITQKYLNKDVSSIIKKLLN